MAERDWVHVDERLPEPGKWVVAWKGNVEDELRSDQLPFKLVQAWFIHDERLRVQERITHWYELPEPPHTNIFGDK